MKYHLTQSLDHLRLAERKLPEIQSQVERGFLSLELNIACLTVQAMLQDMETPNA